MRPTTPHIGVLILAVSFGLIAAACTHEEAPPLSEEMTITLLVEMHLLQGQRDTDLDDIPPREHVFQHYEVSEDQFDETLQYYARHPDKYKDLYSKVMDSLQVERDPEYYQQFQGS